MANNRHIDDDRAQILEKAHSLEFALLRYCRKNRASDEELLRVLQFFRGVEGYLNGEEKCFGQSSTTSETRSDSTSASAVDLILSTGDAMPVPLNGSTAKQFGETLEWMSRKLQTIMRDRGCPRIELDEVWNAFVLINSKFLTYTRK